METQKQTKTQPRTLSRRAEAIALACLVACLGALGLRAATQITTFDPAAATVGNARLLSLAIVAYTQDNDELLPPTATVGVFQRALHSYVPDPAIFVSRATGKPFIPNPAISGKSLAAFSRPDTTVIFRDGAAQSTVAFLDSHIERGGVPQNSLYGSSYGNAKALSLGILQYVQDYDERYPPMKTQAEFQTAVFPYVKSARPFIDPANGKPFVPNPAISGVSLASIANPSQTILFQSAMPYQNGVPTIGYADGHVTPMPPSDVSNTARIDADNLKQIGLATIQYAQDYDEILPQTNNDAIFAKVLQPYVQGADIFTSPGTGLPYILNPAVSSLSLAEITDPVHTGLARDAQLNPDGTFNTVYIDGHLQQTLYYVPKVLSLGLNNETAVLWPKATGYSFAYGIQSTGEASVWTLSPTGKALTQNSYTLPDISRAFAISVGEDGATRLLWRRGYKLGTLNVSPSSAITLDTIGADGFRESSTQFGPYDGWTAFFLTTGADNSSRLLWQRYDGTLALWTLSPEGDYLSSAALPRLGGGTPVGLALGPDGLTRLLWQTTRGGGKLWSIAPSGQVVHSFDVPAPSGYQLTALGLGTDGASRILWSDGKNHAVVRTLRANGSLAGSVAFTLPGGGTASQIAAGKAGDLRVLWEASDGSGQLQTLTATGTQTGVQSLTPYL